MPKNKGKGGKNRRRGKNENEDLKRELIFREACQQYAQVMKMLGNGRLEAQCFDGVKRLSHIRGKLRKKVWINCGDIILVGLREFQDVKADVILKYTPDEARKLQSLGEIPNSTKINEEEGGDDIVEFNYQEGDDAVESEESQSGSSEDESGNATGTGKSWRSGNQKSIAPQYVQAGMMPDSDDDSSSSDEEEVPQTSYQRSKPQKSHNIDIDKIWINAFLCDCFLALSSLF